MSVSNISIIFNGILKDDNSDTISRILKEALRPKSGVSKGNYGKMLANRRGKRQPGNGRSRS